MKLSGEVERLSATLPRPPAFSTAITGFYSLVSYRFLLGIFEPGGWTGAVKTVAERFLPAQRSLAAGIFTSGPGSARSSLRRSSSGWVCTWDGVARLSSPVWPDSSGYRAGLWRRGNNLSSRRPPRHGFRFRNSCPPCCATRAISPTSPRASRRHDRKLLPTVQLQLGTPVGREHIKIHEIYCPTGRRLKNGTTVEAVPFGLMVCYDGKEKNSLAAVPDSSAFPSITGRSARGLDVAEAKKAGSIRHNSVKVAAA